MIYIFVPPAFGYIAAATCWSVGPSSGSDSFFFAGCIANGLRQAGGGVLAAGSAAGSFRLRRPATTVLFFFAFAGFLQTGMVMPFSDDGANFFAPWFLGHFVMSRRKDYVLDPFVISEQLRYYQNFIISQSILSMIGQNIK